MASEPGSWKSNKPLELSKGGTFIVTDIDHAISGIEAFKKDRLIENKSQNSDNKSEETVVKSDDANENKISENITDEIDVEKTAKSQVEIN